MYLIFKIHCVLDEGLVKPNSELPHFIPKFRTKLNVDRIPILKYAPAKNTFKLSIMFDCVAYTIKIDVFKTNKIYVMSTNVLLSARLSVLILIIFHTNSEQNAKRRLRRNIIIYHDFRKCNLFPF